jgi:outer membrane protein OmpA-like peptidoglycan-associated protein
MASPALAGEGWYLGLGAGWDHLENPKMVGDAVDGHLDARNNAIYAGTFGYKFRGLPFRLEAEAAWDRHSTGTFEDFGVDYGSHGHAEVRSAMLNGIFDYHLLPRLKLSVGGGAGVGQSRIKFSDLLGTGDYSSHSGTHFMWQGIGGLAYDIAPNWDLFVDYHYRNLRNGSNDNIAAPLSTHDLTEHVVLAGFRWYTGSGERVAEAPPEPPPPPPPPPLPPAPVKNFIVFFDFNKSNLTADAESIVRDAVKAAQAGNMVKVLITGHTDTVGSHSYNQGLSERRAEAVKDEMVRQGMNGGQISTVGKSYDDPLVPTGPGVREPQNRRAVIQLGDNAGM